MSGSEEKRAAPTLGTCTCTLPDLTLLTLPNRTYLLIPSTPTTTTTTGSSATPHYQIRAGTNETIPFDSNSFWTHAASPGTTAFALRVPPLQESVATSHLLYHSLRFLDIT